MKRKQQSMEPSKEAHADSVQIFVRGKRVEEKLVHFAKDFRVPAV